MSKTSFAICALLALLSIDSAWSQKPADKGDKYAGYYEAPPKPDQTTNLLCVRPKGPGQYEFEIETAICPSAGSTGCMNVKIDGVIFTAKPKSGRVAYSDADGCHIDIRFGGRRAAIKQGDSCLGPSHPWIVSTGNYERKAEGAAPDKRIPAAR